MGIKNQLPETRGFKGFKQVTFSKQINVSRSLLAMVETGERKLPKDVAPAAVQALDDGFFTMAVAEELTGGYWVSKLDGDNVDLHRSSVKEKTMEEMKEAMEVLQRTSTCNRNADKEEIKIMLLQMIDVAYAIMHLVSVFCREYNVSWIGMWKEHRSKLKQRGYMK